MKAFVVLMLLAGVAVAAPGGYLAAGGVFDFGERNLDFIQQARDAGRRSHKFPIHRPRKAH